jgi:protein-tyrosine phosphatase
MCGGSQPTKSRPRLLPGIILAACLLGGATWLWEKQIKYQVIPKRWGTVEKHQIYRSGQLSAALVKRTLRNHGIKVIVALNGDAPQDKNQQAERRAAEDLGIELLRFPLRGDGTGEVYHYVEAIAAVARARQQGKPVLVHCSAGVQRTGGVIACYQLLVEGRTPAQVLKELRRGGWETEDVTLLNYLNQNLATIAALLHDRGIIAKVPDPLPVLPVAEPPQQARLGA